MEITILSDEKVCANCKHFRCHYVKCNTNIMFLDSEYEGRNKFIKTEHGHCCTPRMKNRKATDTCVHFEKIIGGNGNDKKAN